MVITRTVTPSALVRALASLPGSFHLQEEGRTFVGTLPIERVLDIVPDGKDVPPDDLPPDVPRWVGRLPYEAFRHGERAARGKVDERPEPHVMGCVWQRYEAVGVLDGDELVLYGSTTPSGARLLAALERAASFPSGQDDFADLPPAGLSWAAAKERPELHIGRVNHALECIARGELYQVNLARRYEFAVHGHAATLLLRLGPLGSAPFAAAIDFGDVQVISTSPELFLDVSVDGRVITRPIKGTRPRSANPLRDEELRRELDESEKERAELAMVVDLERNDLGRVAIPGSVVMSTPPHVVSHPTVHHREATVEARLRPDVSLRDLLVATMPSGSVTGAPKTAAMDLIARLEAHRRGLYTGALGTLSAGGRLRLSMAIRVLTIKDGVAHYFAGGGIVADSDPNQEVLETDWKAEQLRALVDVGGEGSGPNGTSVTDRAHGIAPD